MEKPITRLQIGKKYLYTGKYSKDDIIGYYTRSVKEVPRLVVSGVKPEMKFIPMLRIFTVRDYNVGCFKNRTVAIIDFDELWEIKQGMYKATKRTPNIFSIDFLYDLEVINEDNNTKQLLLTDNRNMVLI
jgi:hypothetical protein